MKNISLLRIRIHFPYSKQIQTISCYPLNSEILMSVGNSVDMNIFLGYKNDLKFLVSNDMIIIIICNILNIICDSLFIKVLYNSE